MRNASNRGLAAGTENLTCFSAKLCYNPISAEVAEWQTRQTQNLLALNRAGSSPAFGMHKKSLET